MRRVIFPLLIIAGLALGFAMSKQLLDSLASYTWNETPCDITQSQVIYDEENGSCAHKLGYTYFVNNQNFSGHIWRLDPGVPADWCSSLASLAGETPTNSKASCYVDPEKPERAVQDKGSLYSILGMLVPLLIIIVGVIGLKFQNASSPVITAARVKVIAKYVALTAFIFTTAGGIYMGIVPIIEVIQAASWQQSECTILSSGLKTSGATANNSRRGYQIVIVYSYNIEQQTYVSDRFDFIKWGSGSAKSLSETTEQYPTGAKVACYVDPQNSYESVIDRDYGIRYLAGFAPFLFSFATLVLLIVSKKML